MSFSSLRLIDPLLRAVAAEGYEIPTPIQTQAIPPILEGRDLLGCAQTGTGKTAAFALPMLQRLAGSTPRGKRALRALVLSPTRELAAQIGASFAAYGKHLPLRHTVIFGGVGQLSQEQALARHPEILVATPGRLLDLCSQRKVNLADIEIFVLDEADRMLDMGFIHDVRKVIAQLPAQRQTLFFSATMPPDIVDLSSRILHDPARVAVTPVSSTAEKVTQKVFFVDRGAKRALLEDVLGDPAIERALVFTRTKHGANRVAEQLSKARIGAEVIHGNKSQNARERALSSFKNGTTRVLVATDIAARGIDVEGVSHVINFDLPDVPESYVHRIGRTARAGASGVAFSFCDSDELSMLTAIERLIRARIPVDEAHPSNRLSPSSGAPSDDRPRRGPPPHRDGRRAPERYRDARPGQGARGGHGPAPQARDARPGNAPHPHAGHLHAERASHVRAPAAHGDSAPQGGAPRAPSSGHRRATTPRSQRRYVTS